MTYRVKVYGVTKQGLKVLPVTCYGPKAVMYAVNKLSECYPSGRVVISTSK